MRIETHILSAPGPKAPSAQSLVWIRYLEEPLGERGGLPRGDGTPRGVALTIKQVLAAFLEQTADVERDEELGSKRIAIQVTGQRKGTLQNRDQQEATGGGFSMPTLDLVESTETVSSPTWFRQEKILLKEQSSQDDLKHVHLLMFTGSRLVPGRKTQSNLANTRKPVSFSIQLLFTAQASAISPFLSGGRDWRELFFAS